MRSLPLDSLGTPDTRSPGRFLLWQARQQKGPLALALLLGILTFSSQTVMPYVFGVALDSGLEQGLTPELWGWSALLLAAAVLQIVTAAWGHRADVVNWLRASFAASELIGDRIVASGDAISEELPTGEVVATVASDALRMGDIYANAARLVGSLCAYVVVAVVMLNMSVVLGLVVTIGLPLVSGALVLLVKPLQARQAAQREAQGRLTTLGADTVSGLRILRGIGGEKVFADRYRAQSQKVKVAGERVAVTQSWLDGLQILLPYLMLALVLWLGAREAVKGNITAGQLVTFFGYASFLTWPMQNIVEVIQFVTRAFIASRKILNVLRTDAATRTADAPVAMPGEDAELVDETTGFVVAPGRVLALVCHDPDASAAVATRLGRLDDELEEPTPVRLGGVLLRDLDKAALRRRIVIAEATPHLFTGSLRAGLDIRHGASDESILAALHVADAGDVLDSTPGGLDGEITEKGRTLSGGQRQRVALARALLTDAEVLVLIEPTSAVDAHTEARIAERLAAARRGRTTVIVTASPLVLDHVDEVALLAGGSIVARGTHRSLIADQSDRGARYRAVVDRSMDTPDDAALAHASSPVHPTIEEVTR
ncbi:ABC transporter ATP-binding protein [Sanguibacter sp. A247]|uniref:ABC transporter ATP-binding protein n=1 Tax=unclassified Sanguibacter TaxID=2645534 RepID=UPI003FD7C305